MLPNDLQQYLHTSIPLAHAMQVSVDTAETDVVVLRAPWAPNANPHGTVFGGSAVSLAILAGWSLLHVRLLAAGHAGQLVIQRQTMEYERPVASDITAHARLAEPAQWPRFLRMLTRHGKARLSVDVRLDDQDSRQAGRFHGEFVVLRHPAAETAHTLN
jgi:thioesterase domain-containing protein